MEPTGPISSRGTPATQLLDSLTTVQPLMWSLELERANHRFQTPSGIEIRSPYRSVWREISERTRQRGTDALSGKDWPGAVYLPAWIIHKLMAKGALTAPASWKPLDSGSAAKLIGLLGGWQQDRGLYEFSVLPSKIIRQGEVNVLLDLKTFAGMPSYTFYIDLESIRDPLGADNPELADDIPPGFLVGLNIHKDVPELVMASVRNGNVVIESLPLDGASLDSHAARLHAKVGPGRSGRLSIMISALLMICLYRTKIEQVHDGASEYGIVKVWNRWRVGESFNETITRAYKDAKLRQPGVEPCIVAHWGPVGDSGSGVTLRCSMGTSIDWKQFSNPKKKVTAEISATAEIPDIPDDVALAGNARAVATRRPRAPRASKPKNVTAPLPTPAPTPLRTKKRSSLKVDLVLVVKKSAKKATATKVPSAIAPALQPASPATKKAGAGKTNPAILQGTPSKKVPAKKGMEQSKLKTPSAKGAPKASKAGHKSEPIKSPEAKSRAKKHG